MADEVVPNSPPTQPSTTVEAPTPPENTNPNGSTLLTQSDTPPADVPPGDKPPEKVEAKPEEKPEAPVVPEKYEVKAPEGMELDSAAIEKLSPVFKKHNLSNEAVQEIVDAYSGHMGDSLKAQDAQFEAWLKTETKNNETALRTEFGSQYDTNIRSAQKAIGRFADASVKKVLDDTGLGSHPGMVKMFAKIGAMVREDSPALVPGQLNEGRKSTAQLLYGKTN